VCRDERRRHPRARAARGQLRHVIPLSAPSAPGRSAPPPANGSLRRRIPAPQALASSVAGVAEAPVEAVVFDYGGVISSPLFRGIGRFEAEMGYPPGSVFELMFGEVHYPGVEGIALTRDDATAPRPDDEVVRHDFHRLEIGEMSLAEYMSRLVERAPTVLGRPIDFAAYQRFTAEMPMGVHWPVVHRIRELRDVGLRLALLTNNVKEFGDSWRAMFPVDDLFEVIVDSSAV